MKKAVVVLLLVLTMTLSSCDIILGFFSGKGSLSGTVNDAVTGTGLSGVTVTLRNSSGT
ncbi:MAG: hypothetical protein NT061_02760 [Spirochaetes bacterium]|nr:hypothetical protein [Spirochaetota bacterium]